MPTSIYKYDGTLLTTVADATLDSTHSTLRFPGKGYQNYGEPIMENFVWMLQNFSGTTAPTLPLSGQIWYDTSIQALKVYNGLTWAAAGGVIINSAAPVAGSSLGDFWYDSLNLQLNTWNGTSWDLVGPLGSAANDPLNPSIPSNSKIDAVRISDGAINHNCWRVTVGGTVLAIISKDASFNPAPSISGFTSIVPGINLSGDVAGIRVSGDDTTFTNAKSNRPSTDNAFNLGESNYRFASFYTNNTISNYMAVNAAIGSYTFEVNGTSNFRSTASFIGTTTAAPMTISTSSNLIATPAIGSIEFDGNNFFLTSNVSGVTTRFAVTPGAAGSFSGDVTINGGTESVSATTGALVVTGGVGLSANLHVGGNIIVAGTNKQIVATSSDSSTIPGFTWSASRTTGLFLAAADTVAITTAGTEKIRVNASGAIGLAGANYGTAGQVMTSSGSAAPPAWTTFGVVPTGGLIPYAGPGNTPPAGWLLCDGTTYNIATYADLGTLLGATYGGNGTTTFAVPDMRGRVPAGVDNMGGTAANRLSATGLGVAATTIGNAGGDETEILTTSQMPAHNHGAGIGQNIDSTAFVYGGKAVSPLVVPNSMAEDTGNTAFQALTETIGGGAAHQNVQPTIVLNYLIKT